MINLRTNLALDRRSFIVFVLLLLCGCNSRVEVNEAWAIKENKKLAQGLIDNVYLYGQSFDEYPKNIQALEDYVKEIPTTLNGNQFEYLRMKPDTFVVTFYMEKDSYCSYQSRSQHWDCGFYLSH